jgi:hypothetical protein
MAQVEDCLPSKHKVQSSGLVLKKRKESKEKKKVEDFHLLLVQINKCSLKCPADCFILTTAFFFGSTGV